MVHHIDGAAEMGIVGGCAMTLRVVALSRGVNQRVMVFMMRPSASGRTCGRCSHGWGEAVPEKLRGERRGGGRLLA